MLQRARGAYASEQLAGIAARLRAVGDRGLTRQTRATLRGAAKPLTADVRAAAEAQLPKSGGLNQHVAKQRITVTVPLSKRTAAVRLRMPFIDAKETDSGYVRHPVYADRSKPRKEWTWIKESQQLPQAKGWWSKTLAKAGPKVTAELIVLMRAVNREIDGHL